jgi:hypothetical protein
MARIRREKVEDEERSGMEAAENKAKDFAEALEKVAGGEPEAA